MAIVKGQISDTKINIKLLSIVSVNSKTKYKSNANIKSLLLVSLSDKNISIDILIFGLSNTFSKYPDT